jgi:uncharacterized protein YbjT (DUF2867 family)
MRDSLQDGPGDNVSAVHFEGPSALFSACERADVKRIIHFSAIGVERDQPSDFSKTKLQAEEALRSSALDWIILRPSVVIGRAAYGASAMFRGLAALPILPLMPDTGKLQIVQLDDVVETVARLVPDTAPARIALDLAGPEPLDFREVIAAFRAWFGWKPAGEIQLPRPIAKALYGLGDLAGRLGWRPPLRSTAAREIVRGATGDPSMAARNGYRAAVARGRAGRQPGECAGALVRGSLLSQARRACGSRGLLARDGRYIADHWLGARCQPDAAHAYSRACGSQRRRGRAGRHCGRQSHRVQADRLSRIAAGRCRLVLLCRHRNAAAAGTLEGSSWATPQDLADRRGSPDDHCNLEGPMITYFLLKYLHIIGASVLLGTGAGIALFMLLAHQTGKPAVIAGVARIVVIADFVFTTTAVIVQPITGAALA